MLNRNCNPKLAVHLTVFIFASFQLQNLVAQKLESSNDQPSSAAILSQLNKPSRCSFEQNLQHEKELNPSLPSGRSGSLSRACPTSGSNAGTQKGATANRGFFGSLGASSSSCKTDKYRTFDGTFNNCANPLFGSASSPFQRFVPAQYDDGTDSPRVTSTSDNELPNARLISNMVTPVMNRDNRKLTSFVMQWGQYLDHDITLTPHSSSTYGGIIDCSGCDSAKRVQADCFPIQMPSEELYFSSNTCFHFIRSAAAGFTQKQREQLNDITAYIDASQVYGSDEFTVKNLRSHSQGKLKTSKHDDNGDTIILLPENEDTVCRITTDGKNCFSAGDIRVNEHAALTSMHTLSVRAHNNIAGKLLALNTEWDDETLYQETRRIIGAFYQVITYKEFLPALIGRSTMRKYSLTLLKNRHSKKYNPNCNAGILNVFATAGFRMHSLIKDVMLVVTKDISITVPLNDLFLNPELLYKKDHVTGFLIGLQTQQTAAYDRFLSNTIRNRLFELNPKDGVDLLALNVQRGRDHGLPGYLEFRKKCRLPSITSFWKLKRYMTTGAVSALQSTYGSVEDIDAIIGMMAEKPLRGASVGPTVACILAEQFKLLKHCDRFFHEFEGQPGSFNKKQLAQIRKISMARLICDTVDGDQRDWKTRKNVMRSKSKWTNCRNIRDIDYRAFV